MAALAWWLIPIGATVLAIAFVALRSRPARPQDPKDSIAALRAMQVAMERPMPELDQQGPSPRTRQERPW